MNADLRDEQKTTVKALVQGNMSSFAWRPTNIPGIGPQIMSHNLNIYPNAKSVKQRKRTYGAYKREDIRSKVEKLMEAKFVREVDSRPCKKNLMVNTGCV